MHQPGIFSDLKGITFTLTIIVGFATGVQAMPAIPSARTTIVNTPGPLVEPIDTRPDRHCHNEGRFVYCYKKDPNARETKDAPVRHDVQYRHWRTKRSHHELKRQQ